MEAEIRVNNVKDRTMINMECWNDTGTNDVAMECWFDGVWKTWANQNNAKKSDEKLDFRHSPVFQTC